MNFDRSLRLADFQTKFLTGTTASSADTSATFRHASGQLPTWWLVLEGDVYVPANTMGPNTADVRSRRTSESFRLLLFFT